MENSSFLISKMEIVSYRVVGLNERIQIKCCSVANIQMAAKINKNFSCLGLLTTGQISSDGNHTVIIASY